MTERAVVVPGDRIFFTALLKSDVPLLSTWFSDLETTLYDGQVGRVFSLEAEQEWFDGLAKRPDNVAFGIVVRETGALIGTISLMRISHQRGTAELGVTVGDKTLWGQGYGTEAVRLMAEYGCFFLGLYSICLWYLDFNERGRRAYVKAGFREAGRWRKAIPVGGERYNSVLMDITRDELDLSRMRAMIGLLPTQEGDNHA